MKYIYAFLTSLSKSLTYRANFALKLVTVLFETIISLFMWIAIYKFNNAEELMGISSHQMMVYLLLVNLISLIFAIDPIFELSKLIRNGNLTLSIIRPVNLLYFSFGQYVGKAFPFLLIYLIVLPFSMTTNPIKLIISLLSIVTIYIMFFLLITCISLCSFWLIQVWPLQPIINACFLLLGGKLFPLQLLPSSIRWIVYNPFGLAGNQLALISMGKLSIREILFNFIIAILWILILNKLINFWGRKGLKKFEGVGA